MAGPALGQKLAEQPADNSAAVTTSKRPDLTDSKVFATFRAELVTRPI